MNRIKNLLMNKAILALGVILSGINARAQVAPLPDPIVPGSKINYVRTFDVAVPEKNGNVVISKAAWFGNGVQQTTSYQDGLGRTVQSIAKFGTIIVDPNWGPNPMPVDLISISRYDNDVSQQSAVKSYEYLPFTPTVSSNQYSDGMYVTAFQMQQTFWQTKHPDEHYYYSETRVERSPLGRVEKSLAPGDSWTGSNNGITIQNEFNTALENIRMWNIDFTPGSVPVSTQSYPVAKLSKSIMIDEKGKKVYTYTDFEGRTILKKVQEKEIGAGLEENGYGGWLCTYYVYDDLGQLRSIITPKAVKYLETTNWIFISNDVYQELCFWYEFDERGRAIVKHSPGAGQIQLVYDTKDRLVLSQDENQRGRPTKQWSFYLYDDLDRTIATGLFDNNATRDAMATFVKGLNNGINYINVYTGINEQVRVDNPVAGASGYCNSCSNTVINSVNYYDDYSYTGVKAFNTNFTFAPVETSNWNSPNYNPYVEATITSLRVIDFTTGTKTRVIDNNHDDGSPANDIFLTSTIYYDEKGRAVQALSDNIKGAVDYASTQYDFSGRTIGVCENHTMPGTSINNFAIISKFDFDWIRRVTAVSKKFGNLDYKKLAQYTYDELGRVQTKKISPDYNAGAGIETLKFDYNIRGWLNGINKDFALSTSSLNQWDHFFGMYMGYDNRDNKFAAPQYNGNITGAIWKTQGDNMPRKYDYEYDNASRFTKALFVQKEKSSDLNWASNKMDFSVTDITYDENNNLKQMYQKGVVPGNNSPLYIDKLTYEYKIVAGAQWSNQLRRVYDQPDLTPTNNGSLGDFKDETFGVNGEDYVFDANGNLVKDNNKKIRIGSGNGVVYNFMDKPQKITIESKSITEFIYDADGAKLGKKITDIATSTSKTTWYMGGFIYEEANSQVNLQMILHEEGRIRVYSPVSNPRLSIAANFDLPDNKKGVFDFFIKDNLQNTRAIVTEETHSEFNNATMEDANSYYEERMFGQVDINGNPVTGSNEVSGTRYDKQQWAPGWNANTSVKISKIGRFGKTVGPNMMLKVMAGDNVAAKTDYYYNETPDNTGTNNILPSIVGSLLSSLSYTAPTGSLHGAAGNITNTINTNPGDLGNFLNSQNTGTNATPQAYMNILFFDENFNFVPYDNVTGLGSNAWRVGAAGDGQSVPIQIAKAPKNGYAFVYISNESKTYVYFDNLEVTHIRGRLIEENAYYPYGLKIKGISGKAFDKGDNKYGYQGDFSEEDAETGWDEFDLRMYDAQIGKWTGVDPYDEFASGYIGMGSNPVNFVDEDGGKIGDFGAILGMAAGTILTNWAINAYNNNNPNHKIKGVWRYLLDFTGGAIGAGLGYAAFESIGGEYPGYFGAHFRRFYKGLVGGTGSVDTRFNGYNDNSGISGIHHMTQIEMPSFHEWTPSRKWITVNVQFWANIERAVRRTSDQIMTRTITGNRVQDMLQTTVPLTPPDNRGRRTSRLRTQVSFNTKTRINANINGQNVTVVFNQPARQGRRLSTSIRVKLKTQHRVSSESLKIFGIKTFIKRKI
jgi:RHS repeat-associated protein